MGEGMPFLKNSAIFIFSVLLTLWVLEGAVRVFTPQDLRLNFSQWDDYVGFVNIPGIEGTTTHTDFHMKVRINSKGLRDREFEYEKEPGIYRIGIFGDSFTFGEGVQNDETYPKLLEDMLRSDEQLSAAGKKIEVLNFGIGKTGTSHQYALYRKEGKKYGLDLVIIGFLGANDFSDNIPGVFALEQGQLIHKPTNYSSIRKLQKIVYYVPFYKWLTAHSHLVNLVRKKATVLDDRWRTAPDAPLAIIGSAQADKEPLAVDITLKLISEFVREAKQAGSKVLLVNLPAKDHAPYSPGGKNEPHIVYYHQLEKELRKIPGLEIVDLAPLFNKLPVRPYYFEHDSHMTPLGLQLVALGIKDRLKPKLAAQFTARAGKEKKLNLPEA